MRRRVEPTVPPDGLDLDAALRWLSARGASYDEIYAYWEAHEDFDSQPDPRLGVVAG